MANILLAWPNYTDEATLSGGSWQASLPLDNLKNRQVQKIARSTNAATSSTVINASFGGSATKAVGAIALVVHNMSTSARVRAIVSSYNYSKTSLILDPNNFTTANWTRYFVSVTTNATQAPSGISNAQKIEATSAVNSYVLQTYTNTTEGLLTVIKYIKKGSAPTHLNEFELVHNTTNTVFIQGEINLDTGQVTTSVLRGASYVETKQDADGWWQIRAVVQVTDSSMPANSPIRFRMGHVLRNAAIGDFAYFYEPLAFPGNDPAAVSEFVRVWPTGVIPQDLLQWEDDNFWLGTMSETERAGYQSPFVYALPNNMTATNVRVEIYDPNNPDGYVQIGRMFLGTTWTPSVNYTYGSSLQYEDPTPIERSLSGAEYFDIRSKFRVFDFDLEFVTNTEAYTRVLELQRLLGVSGEILVAQDLDDAQNIVRRTFVGRLLDMKPMRQVKPDAQSVGLKIKELL